MLRSLFTHVFALALFGFVLGSHAHADHSVPQHKYWTLQQCLAFWGHVDRGIKLKVVTGAETTPRDPLPAEYIHSNWIVEANVTPQFQQVGSRDTVVVKLGPTGGRNKAPKLDFKDEVELRDVISGHPNNTVCYSQMFLPENLNIIDPLLLDRRAITYQAPWAGADPIYEGATIGVIIDGKVPPIEYVKRFALLVGALIAALAAVAFAITRAKSSSRSKTQRTE